VYVKDHHTVHFGGEGEGGPAGRGQAPTYADAAACSRPQAQPGGALDAARAVVLARLASGQAAGFEMRTAPALATPWGRAVPIAEMLFSFAADAPPPATGFTVRCPPLPPQARSAAAALSAPAVAGALGVAGAVGPPVSLLLCIAHRHRSAVLAA